MLELKHISYAVREGDSELGILNDISLTIDDHRLVVFTGPNGGGKTTLRTYYNTDSSDVFFYLPYRFAAKLVTKERPVEFSCLFCGKRQRKAFAHLRQNASAALTCRLKGDLLPAFGLFLKGLRIGP